MVTRARPAPGSPNLVLTDDQRSAADLPGTGEKVSPRNGSEAAYAAVAAAHPEAMFVVSCDLDASTKLGKARALLAPDHAFEMSIEEQAACLIADGLAVSSREPQLNVVSTFAAFFEGIAREGFDMWRYQRNLTGVNEGLNVTFHLSHVGACTGRDHFSGWGLDWINVGLTYLPYLHRFYAPADARAAFLAVVDLAAHYGGTSSASPGTTCRSWRSRTAPGRCGNRRTRGSRSPPTAAPRAPTGRSSPSGRRPSSPARRRGPWVARVWPRTCTSSTACP